MPREPRVRRQETVPGGGGGRSADLEYQIRGPPAWFEQPGAGVEQGDAGLRREREALLAGGLGEYGKARCPGQAGDRRPAGWQRQGIVARTR